jgi:hypothetical protein
MPESQLPVADVPVERQLDRLQRESQERRQELRRIAAQLPATMSRRAIIRSVAADLRGAPNKGDVVARAVRKLARAPRRAFRGMRHSLRRRAS